jgi:hypothetical protein
VQNNLESMDTNVIDGAVCGSGTEPIARGQGDHTFHTVRIPGCCFDPLGVC